MKQDTGLKRNQIDKYYTKSDVVKKCIKIIIDKLDVCYNDICIEPSAGNGSFINDINSICKNGIFYDIEPESESIIQQDYLTLEISKFEEETKNIHVIGNPPFGRQSSLAIKFIKKSATFCDSISFILPKSFKKESLQKHFPKNFHLIYQEDLPNDSFTINDDSYNVPCVFQVWIKKEVDRMIPEKLKPKGFKFVSREDNPDISFRRVGVYAGRIDRDVREKSVQSHYFIKFDEGLGEEKFSKLSSIDYKSKDDTVGPRSISKQEMIRLFNIIS